MKTRRAFWMSFVLGLMASGVVGGRTLHADLIYSGTSDGPWQQGAAATRLSQTFSTGASPMTLDSVGVWVRNANESNSSATAGTLTLELFAVDGSNKPTGSSLLTVVNAQSVDAWGDGWVTGTSLGYPLSANTTYALAFIGSGGSTMSWKYNDSTAIASSVSPTPTFFNWQSPDNGATWSDASPTTGFNMQVTTTAVPEPTALAMVATGVLGACGLVGVRRRR